MCGDPERVYRSIYADGLSLPYYTYGLDVIVTIGQAACGSIARFPKFTPR